jgi:hypothetical protein
MTTADDSEMAVETQSSDTTSNPVRLSEPTLLDHWRFERRLTDETSSDWRSAVPAELFERIRARSAAAAVPTAPVPAVTIPSGSALNVEAGAAAVAPLPSGYRAPFLPEIDPEPEAVVESLGWESDSDLLPAEALPVRVPSAFLGLDWSTTDSETDKVLVSVRPILDAEMAEKVAELLDRAPGMSSVKSLGSDGDVAAFEAEYHGPVETMEAVSQALKGIGASLVSTGDREFYLAIQGQAV